MSKFQIYKTANYEWRWRLRANNHKIIAVSGEGYRTKNACQKGIDSVKKVAKGAEVKEIYLITWL